MPKQPPAFRGMDPAYGPGTPVTITIGEQQVTGHVERHNGEMFADPWWFPPEPGDMNGHFVMLTIALDGGRVSRCIGRHSPPSRLRGRGSRAAGHGPGVRLTTRMQAASPVGSQCAASPTRPAAQVSPPPAQRVAGEHVMRMLHAHTEP